MHTDEGAADVKSRAGAHFLHRAGGVHPLPDGGGKGAAGFGLRNNVDALETVQAARRVFHDQSAVEMLSLIHI